MKNYTLYQLYFRDDQVQFLDPLYTPYDNRENLKPLDREYPILKKIYDLSVKNGDELWGGFTWRFRSHYGGSALHDPYIFHRHIEQNPGYDVYFFNKWTDHVSLIYNVWEQGQWCHPHLLTIMNEVLPLMGLSTSILEEMQTRTSIFYGSMAVGNRKFWDNYFNWVDSYYMNQHKLSDYIRELHDRSAGYSDVKVGYFPFIQERLMSTFIHLTDLKVMPFHLDEHNLLYELTYLHSLKQNHQYLHWCNVREPYRIGFMAPTNNPDSNINWGRHWINKKLRLKEYSILREKLN